MTELFPDDDPYLNEDTVFGVREDLVMAYEKKAAGTFPEGFARSGWSQGYWRVDFDFILAKAEGPSRGR